VGGDAFLGDAVHLFGADLDLELRSIPTARGGLPA
jgi:hypothetical protein